ncbi:MAG: hypothetical protein WBG51_09065 [Syntrophobacteria bacterium]
MLDTKAKLARQVLLAREREYQIYNCIAYEVVSIFAVGSCYQMEREVRSVVGPS